MISYVGINTGAYILDNVISMGGKRMEVFDKTIQIQASPDIVWKEARKFARKGRIKLEKEPEILVSKGSLKIGYVYLISSLSDGTTQLRHVVAPISAIEDALASSLPFPDALDQINQHPDTLSEAVAGGFMGMLEFPTFEETGEGQLAKIKKRSERKAG